MPTVIPVRLDGLVDPAGIGVTKSDYVTIDPLLRPKALPSDELNRVLDTLVELSQENGLSDGSTPGSTLAWKKSMHEVGLASSSSFNVGLESTVVVTYSAGVCTVAMDASTDLWPVGTARTIVKANTSTFTIVADWGATKTVNGGSIVSTVLPGSHRASATTRGHVAWTILRTGESTFELFGGAPQYDTSGNLQLGSGNVVTSGTVDGRDVSTDGATLDGLASGAALSVKGNATNAAGAVADIAATPSSGGVLRESGGVLGFGTIATAGIADGAVTGAKIAQSGTLDIGAANITTTGTITTAGIKSGAGSPEGVTTAGVGALYRDTTNGWLWQKGSGSGNTGWRIIGTSGTYTPTGTAVLNLDSVTPNQMAWTRVGNVVFVGGSVMVDPTAAGNVSYRITLPVASNLAAGRQLNGTCVTAAASIGFITGDATNDAALVTATNPGTTSHNHFFTFGYEVI